MYIRERTATAAGWVLAWPASATIIDLDRRWYVFGSSGALLVTAVTGLALRFLLAPLCTGPAPRAAELGA